MLDQALILAHAASASVSPVAVLVSIALAGLASWALIWALQPLAMPLGLVDHPRGDRKNHACPTPVTGGIGIMFALAVFFALYPLPMTPTKWAFLAGSGLLLVVGVLDDIYDLRWWLRVLVQVCAALLMVFVGGVRVEQLGPAFGMGDMSLGALSAPFTVFATVGLINAVNMIDGADGICGILVSAAFLMLAGASGYAGNVYLMYAALALMAVTLGFLAHNLPTPWRPRARVFLGNAGSAFLGYAIAWISFRLTQNADHPVSPVLALWLLPIPVMDCLVLILRRCREGRSPFAPGRDHIHHLMRDAGFSAGGLALVLAAASLVIGLCIGQAMRMDVPNPLLLALFGLLCIGWYWLSADRARVVGLLRALRGGGHGTAVVAHASTSLGIADADHATATSAASVGTERTGPAPRS